MGSKGGSAPPPPPIQAPPPPPPAPDPMASIAPMMQMMQGMMNQFAQAQMQMFQALQLPALDIPDYYPDAFDIEQERADILERLADNPANAEQRRRGRASTRVVSPLADENDDIDVLRTTAGGGPA